MQREFLETGKVMKRLFFSSFSFLMLVIFLFGTTGVSFYVHECKSSHSKEVFIYPEIIKHRSSCCCATDVHGTASTNSPVQIEDPGCCKNSHLYFKASFLGFPVFQKMTSEPVQKILVSELFRNIVRSVESEKVSFSPLQDHSPPPMSGRLLVQAIHQIKIPVPFS